MGEFTYKSYLQKRPIVKSDFIKDILEHGLSTLRTLESAHVPIQASMLELEAAQEDCTFSAASVSIML